MKRKTIMSMLLVLILAAGLTGCNKADKTVDDNPPDNPVVTDPVEKAEAILSDWSGLMAENGFTSNEAVYAMTRDKFAADIGEPVVSQATYFNDSTADMYYYKDESGDFGYFIEIDYDGTDVPGDSRPALIKTALLLGGDEDMPSLDDYESMIAASDLAKTMLLQGEPLSVAIDIYGQPLDSDDGAWGYATWRNGDISMTIFTDADGNILYTQSASLWDEVMTVE